MPKKLAGVLLLANRGVAALGSNLSTRTIMAKDKKKHAKKDKSPVSDGIMDAAALSLKKYRKVTRQIGKLSTGQKVVGGIALLAAGLTYLAKKQAESANGPAELSAAALPGSLPVAAETEYVADAADEAPPAPVTKPRKTTKARKAKMK